MTRLIDLKIKRLTLAAEARIIKRHENAALEKARQRAGILSPKVRRAIHRMLIGQGFDPKSETYAKAFTAAKMGVEIRKSNNPSITFYDRHHSLRYHRITVVRDAARAAHLANAYLKGTAYARVEQPKYDWPAKTLNLTIEVFKTVMKFGGQRGAHVTQREIEAWMRGGKTHWQLAEAQAAKGEAKVAETA